jgi:hypothetical protein
MDFTFTALCNMASWEQQRQIEGGWAYEATLRKSGLLNYSAHSLYGIDKFLDQIRIQKAPKQATAMADPAFLNLMCLLAYYVGEVISRANGLPVLWSREDVEQQASPFAPSEDDLDPQHTHGLTCWVPHADADHPQPYWPLYAILSRVFISGADKSVPFSAGMVMGTPADPRAPLPPVPPTSPPMFAAERAQAKDREFKREWRITPKPWLLDDPLSAVLKAEKDVLVRGRVVFAVPIQVNTLLYQPTWHGGVPGELLYDLTGRAPIESLMAVAAALFALKADDDAAANGSEQTRALAQHLRAETSRVFGMPAPTDICSHPLHVSSTYFDQRHLPDGTLAMPFVPILVHEDHPGIVKLLPADLWPEELRQDWLQASQQKHGRAFTAWDLEHPNKPKPSTPAMVSRTPATASPAFEAVMAQLATQPNDTDALVEAGNMLASGRGVTANARQAFQFFLKAAELGHPGAQVVVGENLLLVDGVGADLVKAQAWLRRAAANSDPDARARAQQLLLENGLDEEPSAKKGFFSKRFKPK